MYYAILLTFYIYIFVSPELLLFQLSMERLKLYNMDAAMFIKTVLADDLAREAEKYDIHDSKSTDY